jgi:hypothetical protein
MFIINFNVDVQIFELPSNLLKPLTEKCNFNVHSHLHIHRPNTEVSHFTKIFQKLFSATGIGLVMQIPATVA